MSRIKNVIEKAESMKWKINPLYDITGIQLMEIYENSRDIYKGQKQQKLKSAWGREN